MRERKCAQEVNVGPVSLELAAHFYERAHAVSTHYAFA
jgi:hypothetical protein